MCLCGRHFITAYQMLIRVLLLTLLTLAAPQLRSADKIGVASINLCADQLALLLADSDQIRSLSNLSHEEAGSYFFETARAYPVNEGHAEQILNLQPDIVIVGQYSNVHTVAMLRDVGLEIFTLPIANSIEAVLENIISVATWVGQPQRGEIIVKELRARLAKIKPPTDERLTAAVFDPNGYTSGASTLRGEVIESAGFSNVAAMAGIESYGKLTLESIINLDPDVLLESPYSPGTWSRAQAVSHHPALFGAGVNPHVIYVPSRMTVCGGPWTIDVIEQLQSERVNLTEKLNTGRTVNQ